MIPKLPQTAEARAERKANLLLASELMRSQATLAFDDVGQRADGWARRVLVVREWLSHPLALAAMGGGAALFGKAGPEKCGFLWRAVRWGWVAWRMWGKRR